MRFWKKQGSRGDGNPEGVKVGGIRWPRVELARERYAGTGT